MKKSTNKKVEEIKEIKPLYSVTLKIGNKEYKGEGETAVKALEAMPKPEKIMLKGTLHVTDGQKNKRVLMYPVQIRRLFYSKMQHLQIKLLTLGMK